jgi:lipoprotein-anchoring transpeptidase ErfK/SrfK
MNFHRLLVLLGTAALSSCVMSDSDTPATDTTAALPAPAPQPSAALPPAGDSLAVAPTPTPATADVSVEVNLSTRKLTLSRGGAAVATHSVAIGSTKWPTKTGEWTIKQVIWNPDWVPPDESWAEEREPRESGDPKNPLGRIQLVYDAPRSIHGTTDPTSIGKAVSHGSIRVTNEVGVQLAKQIMDAAGVGKDEAWYQNAQQNRKTKQVIDLPRAVPIRVF